MSAIVLVWSLCFGAIVDQAYFEGDSDSLRSLYDVAETRRDSLLVLYRLYPLTQDKEILQDLPETINSAPAAELALLSALWAFRIEGAGPIKLISYGRKSMDLLKRAVETNPDDPFVLLSEGQSLFYRPEWAGGDKRAALQRFERLRSVIDDETCGLSALEADMWRWLVLSALGSDVADTLRSTILEQRPPPLVQQFVTEPPP